METFWINSRLFYQVHIQAPKHQDPLTLKHFRALWRAWIRWIHWRGPFHRALLTCTPLSTGPQKEPWQVTHWMVLSTVHIGRDRWIAQYNDTLGTLCTHTMDASVNNPACVRQERSSFIAKTNIVLSTVHIGRDRWIAQYNDTLGTLCTHTMDASVNNPACVRQERSSFIAKTNIVVFVLFYENNSP